QVGKLVPNYWEIIADDLKKAGWSLGWVSAVDSEGRTIWIADAHRGDGKRFVVRADEKLNAFLELEAAIWSHWKQWKPNDKSEILRFAQHDIKDGATQFRMASP